MGGNAASRPGHAVWRWHFHPGCDGERLMKSMQEQISRLVEYLIEMALPFPWGCSVCVSVCKVPTATSPAFFPFGMTWFDVI